MAHRMPARSDNVRAPLGARVGSLTPYGISEVLTPPAVRACPGQRGRRRLVWVRACQRDGIDSAASGPDSDAWVAQSAAHPAETVASHASPVTLPDIAVKTVNAIDI